MAESIVSASASLREIKLSFENKPSGDHDEAHGKLKRIHELFSSYGRGKFHAIPL